MVNFIMLEDQRRSRDLNRVRRRALPSARPVAVSALPCRANSRDLPDVGAAATAFFRAD